MREESVNLSNIKLGIYEFLGLVIPGMLLLCEGWIFVRGWPRFTSGVSGLNAVSFTLLLLTSFLLGHFVQELADACLKRLRGERFFKKGRDDLWASTEAEAVKSAGLASNPRERFPLANASSYCSMKEPSKKLTSSSSTGARILGWPISGSRATVWWRGSRSGTLET